MRAAVRKIVAGSVVVGTVMFCPAAGLAQTVPDGRLTNPDAGKTQREQVPVDLSPIEKEKPEIEIFTGSDVGTAPPTGIVIVPEETGKPSPAPPPDKEHAPPAKTKPGDS